MGWSPCVSNPKYEPGILQLLIPCTDDDMSRCVSFSGLFVTWWVSFLSFHKEQTAHFNCFRPFRICARRVCEGQCRRQPALIQSEGSSGQSRRAAGFLCSSLVMNISQHRGSCHESAWVKDNPPPCECEHGSRGRLMGELFIYYRCTGWYLWPGLCFFMGTMLCHTPDELSPLVKHSGIWTELSKMGLVVFEGSFLYSKHGEFTKIKVFCRSAINSKKFPLPFGYKCRHVVTMKMLGARE